MISGLKHTHMLMAILTIGIYILLGLSAVFVPKVLRHKAISIATHVIYTLLLLTAIALLFAHGWNPLAQGWIMTKIGLLVIYIGLAVVAFKPKFPAGVRVPAYFAGLVALSWAWSSAWTKMVWPFAL